MSSKRLYALWCESPNLVRYDDLWRVLAMIKERDVSQLGAFLAEVARRDLGNDPIAARKVRNVLRDLPEQLKGHPLWEDAMRRAIELAGDEPAARRTCGVCGIGVAALLAMKRYGDNVMLEVAMRVDPLLVI
jgi:hypothetical protein